MNETEEPKKIMNVNEMWSVVKGEDSNWGVEGYEVPRQYLDAKQIKYDRERPKMMKENQGKWPPGDWPKVKKPGETVQVKPKRPNYLDQVYKWANSFYNEEKAKTIMQELKDKNRPMDKPLTPPKIDKTKRKTFLEYEEEKKKKLAEYSDYPKYDEKVQWIEKAKEKIAAFNEKNKKDKITLIKEKYKKFGSLPKCDKITIVSDALHCGEKIPFYNTFVKEGEEQGGSEDEGKSKKKKEKPLFFPSKNSTWSKAPAWIYPKPKVEKKLKEEGEDKKSDDEEGKKKFDPVDIRKAYHNMTHHGNLQSDATRVNFFFSKPFDKNAKDYYKTWKENNPKLNPGPQHYWKTLPFSKTKKKKGSEEEPEQVEGQPKIYRMNREKTDKRIYKPMKTHIF